MPLTMHNHGTGCQVIRLMDCGGDQGKQKWLLGELVSNLLHRKAVTLLPLVSS